MDRYITRTPRNNNNRIAKGPAGNYLTVIQLNCDTGGLISVSKQQSSRNSFTMLNLTSFYSKKLGSAINIAQNLADIQWSKGIALTHTIQ